jgi:hypothetical protein
MPGCRITKVVSGIILLKECMYELHHLFDEAQIENNEGIAVLLINSILRKLVEVDSIHLMAECKP